MWNILVTGDRISDELAYNIVKTIFDYKPELVAVHREADNLVIENQIQANSPVPFHPGAAKYFREKGARM